MSDEFEPFDKEIKTNEFNPWEFKINKPVDPESEVQNQLISELDAIKQAAHQEGYDSGLQKAQDEMNALKTDLLKWIELLKKPIHIIDEQLTQEIIRTIICLCKNSIAVELSINPDKLSGLLNKIKKELPSFNSKKILKMHPDDVEWIKANFPHKEIEGLQDVLVADTELKRGDFYLQGEHSELDGRIETRLATLFDEDITTDYAVGSIGPRKDENESI